MPYNKKCHATKEMLEELYHGEGLSQAKIAKMFEINQASLWAIFRRMGITSRKRGEWCQGENHWAWKGGEQRRPYRQLVEAGLLTKEKCRECGTTEKLGIHHKDLDHFNNSLSNLEVLCLHCHLSLHAHIRWFNHKHGTAIKSNAPLGWNRAKPPARLGT